MKRKVVWDLFGGGMNSVHKALDPEKYDIYTFDIEDTFPTTHVIDLSQNPSELITKLKEYPKPDIIVASPLCQSFSLAAAMQGGNATWRVDKKTNVMKLRPWTDYIGTRYKPIDQWNKGKLGLNCLLNTIILINEFEPEYWYIENPMNSLMWRMIKWQNQEMLLEENNSMMKSTLMRKHYYFVDKTQHRNVCNYGDYGYEHMKPTVFLSNKYLHLRPRDMKKKYAKDFEHGKRGMDRSGIPTLLIQDIFKAFDE